MSGEGTVLGLSISHDIIVKQHGGTIDVDTMPGAFTEFTIVLPRTSQLSDSAEARREIIERLGSRPSAKA